MQTIPDFASVLVFGLLAAVYLHRCSKTERDTVPLWAYAVTATACAVGDVVANHGFPVIGAMCLVATLLGAVWIARAGRSVRPR